MTMGKYGIGARVRDRDGDEGEIVAKRKGERRLSYDNTNYNPNDWWWPKHDLTVIEVFSSPEKGEVAFSVGDRVVWTEGDVVDDDRRPPNSVGVVEEVDYHKAIARVLFEPPFDGWGESNRNWNVKQSDLAPFRLEAGKTYRTRDGKKVGPMVDEGDIAHDTKNPLLAAVVDGCGRLYRMNGAHLFDESGLDIVGPWVEPAAEPAPTTLTTLTIEAGKFYRTRDGRKVGPMERSWSEWTTDDGTGRLWNDDGTRWSRGQEHTDLVAEWVEPEVKWTIDDAKPGDVVKCEEWGGFFYKVGNTYTVNADGMIPSEDDGVPYVVSGSNGEWSLVRAASDEPAAAPQPKFKVGDIVDLMRDGEPIAKWSKMTITNVARSGLFEFDTDVGLPCNSRELRLSPSPKPKFKAKPGKRYRGKSGSEYDVIDSSGNEFWPLKNAAGDRFWKVDGTAWDGGGRCPSGDDLVAEVTKPAFPVGTKVTLTATVTGNNPGDRTNVQVVVDGLPPGRNSLGVSPRALSLAA